MSTLRSAIAHNRLIAMFFRAESHTRDKPSFSTASRVFAMDGQSAFVKGSAVAKRHCTSNSAVLQLYVVSGVGILGFAQARTHAGAIFIQSVAGAVFAQNDSGGIRVDSSGAQVISQTGSGRIEIDDSVGEIRATTHSGSISIHKANGPVFARNDSGSIEAVEIAGAIDAQTGSGAIRLAQANPAPIRAHTESGAIKVNLANRGGYAIDAHSESGKVSGPGTNNPEHRSSRSLQEHIGW